MKTTKHYVGLDVHKDTVTIAVPDEGRDGEVRIYGKINSDLNAIKRSLRKIGGGGGELHVVYEAGPTGASCSNGGSSRWGSIAWKEARHEVGPCPVDLYVEA